MTDEGAAPTLRCACGTVHIALHAPSPRTGSHLTCECDDCRRAYLWLGKPDPGPDGVTYFQTAPNRISLLTGADKLAAFRWKSPRLLRWYASCCNTPLFNTLDSPKWAFVSLITQNIDDISPLGPVVGRAFALDPDGKRRHKNAIGYVARFLVRVAHARVSGRWRETPLFTADGSPIGPVKTLTHEDRATARL